MAIVSHNAGYADPARSGAHDKPVPLMGEHALGKLASLLRVCGGATLIASMALFMLQGWEGMNDVLRFGVLLAFTGVLAALGFATSRYLDDRLGARLLLGLSLASVTTDLAVAGGLVYSVLGASAHDLAAFATWRTDSLAAAVTVSAGVLLIAPLVSWIAFRVLAGDAARILWRPFMLGGLLMLIPVRDSVLVFSALALALCALLPLVTRAVRRTVLAGTVEGRFALALMVSPVLVMVTRQCLFYLEGNWVYTGFAGVVYLLTRTAITVSETDRARDLLARLALGAIVAFAWSVTYALSNLAIAAVYLLPVLGTTIAALSIDLSRQPVPMAGQLRAVAGYAAGSLYLLNSLAHPAVETALVTVLVGTMVAVWAVSIRNLWLICLGTGMALLGIAYNVWVASLALEFGSASSLAGLGLLIVVIASLLERFGAHLRRRALVWQRDIASWS